MTLNVVGQFVVYVLAFWGLWKVFDTIFHFVFPASKCLKCQKKDEEITRLKQSESRNNKGLSPITP